jgi:hypothetical protein
MNENNNGNQSKNGIEMETILFDDFVQV